MTPANKSAAHAERRPEGKEGAGGGDTGRKSPNDHQKTVQGKNQQGPDDKVGRDVGGGNAGSKGQNADAPMSQREKLTGKQDR